MGWNNKITISLSPGMGFYLCGLFKGYWDPSQTITEGTEGNQGVLAEAICSAVCFASQEKGSKERFNVGEEIEA